MGSWRGKEEESTFNSGALTFKNCACACVCARVRARGACASLSLSLSLSVSVSCLCLCSQKFPRSSTLQGLPLPPNHQGFHGAGGRLHAAEWHWWRVHLRRKVRGPPAPPPHTHIHVHTHGSDVFNFSPSNTHTQREGAGERERRVLIHL